jgi:hypothetical protein
MDITELPCKVIGMSNAEYHGNKQFDSRSFLHSVSRFGGEAQLWMDKGNSLWGGNAATTKGSEFDQIITDVLGGRRFDDCIVVPPDEVLGANGSRSTKAYKEWAAEYGKSSVVCTAETKLQYSQMYDNLLGNEASYELIKETTETQVSVFFDLDGHLLKVRPDACTPTRWWDLKTTSQPWDRLFRSVMDYGYAEQAWLYTEGAKAIGYEPFRMPFVFVQTAPPYRVRVRTIPEQMVEQAGQRLISVMEQVRLRRSTGLYVPADADVIQDLEIPAWAMKQEEEVAI